MQQERFRLWTTETLRAILFFATALLVFSGLRLFFFYFYKADQTLADEWPALWLGLRLDARWFAILLVPSWLLWLLGLWRSFFRQAACCLAIVALAVFVLLNLVNFGFYGFYVTPISSLIFGFVQDDTKAIVATLWRDWPVITYVAAWLALTLLPCLTFRFAIIPWPQVVSGKVVLATAIMLTLLIGILCRGSFGTFPLRQQDLIAGPDPFVNATIQNGVAALVDANKSRKMLELKGGVLAGLQSFGFHSPEEAKALLSTLRTPESPSKPHQQPHVVIALMEGMGRTEFEIDAPSNDMLGRLRPELRDAYVFKNGISSTGGTFPSLESLIFDTPYTPLTQSRYGEKPFNFSNVLDFKKAGYTTVFLTSGTEKWRNIDQNFPRQGFDKIIGAGIIKSKYPQAEVSTWGVGDAWTFRYAESLLADAEQRGEKLLLIILSVTNHPPHHVPDKAVVNPVDTKALPSYVKDDRNGQEPPLMLKTYQYSASALGDFVHHLRSSGLLKKTAMAVTGDHNTRFKFDSSAVWYCQQSVPLIFWLPDGLTNVSYDPQLWAGHRDIFPTMKSLVLGLPPALWQGRNLFAREKNDGVYAFTGLGTDGFAIGQAGAVALDKTQYRCFDVDKALINRTVSKECTPAQKRLGDLARAQRALTDFIVRQGVLGSPSP